MPGETIGTLAKTLGAVPMFASIGQVPQLVTRGVADGVFLPWNAVGDFKLAKTLKFTTVVPGGIYNVTFHVAANPKKWATLSAADRAAIMKISGEAGARAIGGSWDVGDRRGAAYSKSSGAQWTEMDAAFRTQVEKAFRPMRDAWVESAKTKGVDGEAALAFMREQRGRARREIAGTRYSPLARSPACVALHRPLPAAAPTPSSAARRCSSSWG